jgi:hypothetical protein
MRAYVGGDALAGDTAHTRADFLDRRSTIRSANGNCTWPVANLVLRESGLGALSGQRYPTF